MTFTGLKGFSKNSIIYDGSWNGWKIVDQGFGYLNRQLKNNDKVLGFQTFVSFLPTGLQSWVIDEKACNMTKLIKLSPVSKIMKYIANLLQTFFIAVQ